MRTTTPDGPLPREKARLIAAALLLITLLVYGGTVRNDFINYDDNAYVYENADAVHGLTAAGVAHGFTRIVAANWHPFTVLSHLVVAQLFGLQPWAHHAANVLLHASAVVLLFFALAKMTGAIWRSAFVSLVFAIHPLRVESVAWIAERKDVLMGVFFGLTLLGYARYVGSRSKRAYFSTMLFFVGGLLSKPQMVVLPCLLLLLDYWPLKRLTRREDLRPLLVEKLPFFLLAAVSSVITVFAQKGAAVQSLAVIPLASRSQNAVASLLDYLRQTIWPVGLAAFYPYPTGPISAWAPAASALLLVGITALVFYFRRTQPYALAGWLWYLVALTPVLGLVQVGAQARADRYTYLPHVGLAVAITWAVADQLGRLKHGRPIALTLAIAATIAMSLSAYAQTRYWRDSETLWGHAIAVTRSNDTAENNLGCALLKNGKPAEAVPHLQTAMKLRPGDPMVADNLGEALLQRGTVSEALALYRRLVATQPGTAEFHEGLGQALLETGSVAEAISELREAIRLRPGVAGPHCQLGNALIASGEFDAAAAEYEKMFELEPNSALALYDIAVALHRAGRLTEAINFYRKALAISPNYSDAKEFLAQAERQSREGNNPAH